MSYIERERLPEKYSVIFAIWKNGIQLEERLEPKDKYFGYILIPGGSCERGESYESALKREFKEEYGASIGKYEHLGVLRTIDNDAVHFRHVFVITDWKGKLKNVEKRNRHIKVSLKKAKEICIHPISQKVLGLLEDYLSR